MKLGRRDFLAGCAAVLATGGCASGLKLGGSGTMSGFAAPLGIVTVDLAKMGLRP